jgi:hypothetical protein
MITPSHDLPVTRQAKVLGISRGAVYYKARPVSPRDLRIMRQLDELHLWLCYRISAQECWPILAHLRSLNLRCL